MTDREIQVTAEILRINFSLNPVTLYGTGALDFRGTMIEFRTGERVLINDQLIPCHTPKDLIRILADMGLIRPKAVRQLTFNIYKQLKKRSK